MRNSPEEEILHGAMSVAFTVAFWAAPATFIAALAWRAGRALRPLPTPERARMQWGSVAAAAVFWSAIAIQPQRQLANNAVVEKLIAQAKPRAALDYLSAHQPKDFAPGRVLPPKPFERTIFEELPDCIAVIQPGDAVWVRVLLIRRLDEMCSHYDSPWQRRRTLVPKAMPERIKDFRSGLGRYGPAPGGLLTLIDGLTRMPEGNAWLKTNAVFVEGLRQAAKEPPMSNKYSKSEEQQRIDWLAVSNRLNDLGPAAPPSNPTATSPP